MLMEEKEELLWADLVGDVGGRLSRSMSGGVVYSVVYGDSAELSYGLSEEVLDGSSWEAVASTLRENGEVPAMLGSNGKRVIERKGVRIHGTENTDTLNI